MQDRPLHETIVCTTCPYLDLVDQPRVKQYRCTRHNKPVVVLKVKRESIPQKLPECLLTTGVILVHESNSSCCSVQCRYYNLDRQHCSLYDKLLNPAPGELLDIRCSECRRLDDYFGFCRRSCRYLDRYSSSGVNCEKFSVVLTTVPRRLYKNVDSEVFPGILAERCRGCRENQTIEKMDQQAADLYRDGPVKVDEQEADDQSLESTATLPIQCIVIDMDTND